MKEYSASARREIKPIYIYVAGRRCEREERRPGGMS